MATGNLAALRALFDACEEFNLRTGPHETEPLVGSLLRAPCINVWSGNEFTDRGPPFQIAVQYDQVCHRLSGPEAVAPPPPHSPNRTQYTVAHTLRALPGLVRACPPPPLAALSLSFLKVSCPMAAIKKTTKRRCWRIFWVPPPHFLLPQHVFLKEMSTMWPFF